MKAAVVVFPGSTCDKDVYFVLNDILNVPTEFIPFDFTDLEKFSLIILPGGFSYGDYLRVGVLASLTPLMDKLVDYVDKERGYVLGICNGFQILTEKRLLPGALTRNLSNRFICKPISLKVANPKTPLTWLLDEDEIFVLPIAHSDGRYVADKNTLELLEKDGRVIFRYYPTNPNGSLNDIAGIANEKFNVFAMMPHPERACHVFLGNEVGLKIFEGIIKWIKRA